MGNGGDGVCFADQGDFVAVFDNATFFDSGFEEAAVFVREGGEVSSRRDLIVDCPQAIIGKVRRFKESIEFARGPHIVHIVDF